MKPFHKDRRNSPRVNRKLIIKYGTSIDDLSSVSLTENISTKGVYFFSFVPYKVGAVLFCEISRIERELCICLEARIVRLELLSNKIIPAYGVAVEFNSLSITEIKKIKNIFQKQ